MTSGTAALPRLPMVHVGSFPTDEAVSTSADAVHLVACILHESDAAIALRTVVELDTPLGAIVTSLPVQKPRRFRTFLCFCIGSSFCQLAGPANICTARAACYPLMLSVVRRFRSLTYVVVADIAVYGAGAKDSVYRRTFDASLERPPMVSRRSIERLQSMHIPSSLQTFASIRRRLGQVLLVYRSAEYPRFSAPQLRRPRLQWAAAGLRRMLRSTIRRSCHIWAGDWRYRARPSMLRSAIAAPAHRP